MLITTSQIAVFAVAALGLCSNAWSQEPAPSRLPLAFGQPVGIAALEAHRGGDQSVNENRLRATLGDNSASNLTTGTNAISEGSFFTHCPTTCV